MLLRTCCVLNWVINRLNHPLQMRFPWPPPLLPLARIAKYRVYEGSIVNIAFILPK